MDKRISVIIPAYNRADLLPRTIDSVARQTLLPYEVIIVDDTSPDRTPEVSTDLIEKYKNVLNIIYTRHELNKGEGGARNTGIRMATGDYLAFLDSDDEWLPTKLERQVNFLEDTKADGVFCETFLVENDNYATAEQVRIDHDKIIPEHLLTRGCGYGTGTNLMISREAVSEHFFDESMRLFIDVDWLYRVSCHSILYVMHEALTYYHKAPMRSGDYVKMRGKIFMDKYKDILKTWPFYKRLQAYSCMNWSIAHGYQGNGEHMKAARHFALGIFQAPIRNPKHYFEPLKCLINGLMA